MRSLRSFQLPGHLGDFQVETSVVPAHSNRPTVAAEPSQNGQRVVALSTAGPSCRDQRADAVPARRGWPPMCRILIFNLIMNIIYGYIGIMLKNFII